MAIAAVIAAVTIAIVGSGGRGGSPGRAAAGPAAATVAPGDLAVAADYIGLSRPQLRADLRKGKTLAAIAQASNGKSVAGLLEALVDAKRKRLEADVRAGRLSKQQEQTRLAVLRRRAEASVRHAHRAGAGSVRYAIVTMQYLGISAPQLRDARRGGKSLAEIANATPGRSSTGLIDALVADRKRNLEQGLAAGEVSRRDVARVMKGLRARVSRQVERKPLHHG
ncbi:MAG TPA: hypothetical protein VII01_10560 [Solirubrobacteraceae bacterium]